MLPSRAAAAFSCNGQGIIITLCVSAALVLGSTDILHRNAVRCRRLSTFLLRCRPHLHYASSWLYLRPSGSGAGRSARVAIGTWHAARADSKMPSVMSMTWRASSPLARWGRSAARAARRWRTGRPGGQSIASGRCHHGSDGSGHRRCRRAAHSRPRQACGKTYPRRMVLSHPRQPPLRFDTRQLPRPSENLPENASLCLSSSVATTLHPRASCSTGSPVVTIVHARGQRRKSCTTN